MPANANVARAAYREVLQLARRFVQTEDDARDLAQDALLIALDRGFEDWTSPNRRAWLRGVLQKRAAFTVRSAQRRRRRENATPEPGGAPRLGWTWQPDFLATLPPSLRAVATLAGADLCAAEMCWLLQLSSVALRARLSALRRAVRARPELPILPRPEPSVALGRSRAPLLAMLRQLEGRALVTHDPDGHAILLRALPHKNGVAGNS